MEEEKGLETKLLELVVSKYEGEYDSTKKYYEGHGKAIFVGGQIYEGMWHKGLMEGKGKYSWPDGTVYQGDFSGNEMYGCGEIIQSNDARTMCYRGGVLGGKRQGQGELFIVAGEREIMLYQGEWQNDQRHGTGKIIYDDDVFYQGEFRNDLREGKGKMRYRSGNEYIGEWKEDRKEGKGFMYWRTRSEYYHGEWRNDCQEGVGEHAWLSSSSDKLSLQRPMCNRYRGHFVNGKRHGFGVFLYANGAKYIGCFDMGIKNGLGTYLREDGAAFKGTFVQDKLPQDGQQPMNRVNGFWTDAFKPHVYLFLTDISDAALIELHKAILRHASELRRVYQNFSALLPCTPTSPFLCDDVKTADTAAVMTLAHFRFFCQACNLFPNILTLAQIDLLLKEVRRQQCIVCFDNKDCNIDYDDLLGKALDVHSPHRPLLYRDFVEAVVRLSLRTVADKTQTSSLECSAAFTEFVQKRIIPLLEMSPECRISEADVDQTNSLIDRITLATNNNKNSISVGALAVFTENFVAFLRTKAEQKIEECRLEELHTMQAEEETSRQVAQAQEMPIIPTNESSKKKKSKKQLQQELEIEELRKDAAEAEAAAFEAARILQEIQKKAESEANFCLTLRKALISIYQRDTMDSLFKLELIPYEASKVLTLVIEATTACDNLISLLLSDRDTADFLEKNLLSTIASANQEDQSYMSQLNVLCQRLSEITPPPPISSDECLASSDSKEDLKDGLIE